VAVTVVTEEALNAGHQDIAHASGGTETWAFDCTGANLLLVGIVISGTGASTAPSISSITYAGSAMTLLTSATWDTPNSKVFLYYKLSPASGSNNVSFTWTKGTGMSSEEAFYGALALAGADVAGTPFGTPATATDTTGSASPSVNVAGTTAGNLVVGVAGNGGSFTGATSPTTVSWTQNHDTSTAGHNASMSQQAGGGTQTVAFTTNLDWWGIVAVEVLASGGGGGGGATLHPLPLLGVGR
jgi:hypothetical protein